ncbi:hypothetical protein HII36_03865 [Nonomuraea sp. NN258]|uniref:hypothetical protein n=1 Tax=Nonomuraea antri TaxID=2730852 RepID=UPI0015688E96|nr:hypothetical protein [Nonomuraea antri]NRQ30970.1 hypothetical protein [Nonomuraea antri]
MAVNSTDTGSVREPFAREKPRQMSNDTRYLCAAAYLDSGFRDHVMDELLSDPYRAVSPSYGDFDLMPVIHHCRRSRSMLIVRDVLITVILLFGLVVSPLTTIQWVVMLVPFVLLTTGPVRNGPLIVKALIWIWAVWSAFGLFLTAIFQQSLLLLIGGLNERYLTAFDFTEAVGAMLSMLFIPLVTLAVALVYRIAVYLTLAGVLRPGAPAPEPGVTDPKTRARLDYVHRAQHGNITMYANEDAFMGAGHILLNWSIAVELDRVREPEGPPSRRDTPVDIDPMVLHAFVRNRLQEMRDHVLRPNEGIHRLDLGDHVVTKGLFTVSDWYGDGTGVAHPLIDPAGLPRYQAHPDEIAAIARHPQGGVRYYQRVTISNTGQEIRDLNGRLVAPAADQEAITSAFIHLAVEGRMLYTQFVVTVLPPVLPIYHVVDLLPAMNSRRIAWEAVRALKLRLLRDVLAAPVRAARTGVQAVRQGLTRPNPAKYVVYPYGAGFSVREFGADDDLQTHIQRLDVRKYVRMIEQRLTESVLDFLEERGVETGAYRMQAANVTNQSMYVFGSTVSGPIAFGSHASATVNNPPRPAS